MREKTAISAYILKRAEKDPFLRLPRIFSVDRVFVILFEIYLH